MLDKNTDLLCASALVPLYHRYPGRRSHINTLVAHLAPPPPTDLIITSTNTAIPHIPPPGTAFYCCGPTHTGITSLVLDVLHHLSIIPLFLDARSCHTERQAFQQLWQATHTKGATVTPLWDEEQTQDDDTPILPAPSSTSTSTFTSTSSAPTIAIPTTTPASRSAMSQLTQRLSEATTPICFLLDSAVTLTSLSRSFLPSLFALSSSLSSIRTVHIICCDQAWHHAVENATAGQQLIPLAFAPLSLTLLERQLTASTWSLHHTALAKHHINVSMLHTWIQAVIGTVSHGTRDCHELAHVIEQLMPQFLDLARTHSSSMSDSSLTSHIIHQQRGAMRACLEHLFRREWNVNQDIHDDDKKRSKKKRKTNTATATSFLMGRGQEEKQDQDAIENTADQALGFELPRTAKFLICASFLASYNPPQQDVNIFTTQVNRKKRRASFIPKGRRTLSPLLLGPRPFVLDRMLAIFQHISDDDCSLANVYGELATLESLQLLSRTSAKARSDVLSEVRLVCSVSYGECVELARSLGFDLHAYLYTPPT